MKGIEAPPGALLYHVCRTDEVKSKYKFEERGSGGFLPDGNLYKRVLVSAQATFPLSSSSQSETRSMRMAEVGA